MTEDEIIKAYLSRLGKKGGILQGSEAFAGALPNGSAGTTGALAKVAD